MPRKPRVSRGGIAYHVMNRGNNRDAIFHKPADYDAFLNILARVRESEPGVRVLGYCLMANHWHLVLWPKADGQLSRFVQLLSTTHVRRYFAHYHRDSGGHLYQGRFKAFPIQRDEHLLSVLRYVEANPLRAKKVNRGRDWKWSSLSARLAQDPLKLLDEWPVDRPADWEK
jgi:putative transposase